MCPTCYVVRFSLTLLLTHSLTHSLTLPGGLDSHASHVSGTDQGYHWRGGTDSECVLGAAASAQHHRGRYHLLTARGLGWTVSYSVVYCCVWVSEWVSECFHLDWLDWLGLAWLGVAWLDCPSLLPFHYCGSENGCHRESTYTCHNLLCVIVYVSSSLQNFLLIIVCSLVCVRVSFYVMLVACRVKGTLLSVEEQTLELYV